MDLWQPSLRLASLCFPLAHVGILLTYVSYVSSIQDSKITRAIIKGLAAIIFFVTITKLSAFDYVPRYDYAKFLTRHLVLDCLVVFGDVVTAWRIFREKSDSWWTQNTVICSITAMVADLTVIIFASYMDLARNIFRLLAILLQVVCIVHYLLEAGNKKSKNSIEQKQGPQQTPKENPPPICIT